jgi:hypothetical protein
MKMKISAAAFICLAVLCAALFASGTQAAAQEPTDVPPLGGGEYKFVPVDEITEVERESIKREIADSISRLEAAGKLPPARPELVLLSSPLRVAAGASVFHVEAISNYVDHNLAFPSLLRDWNCGVRTYDQASGYNHAGIDYFTFPFGRTMQMNNTAEIIAAAPGTIVLKSDGRFDQSCGFNSNSWNAVYVRHADGSVAWYGHMKNGSLTTKAVGETVDQGEKLGIVGSSGNSTGPHLHLELYNALNQLQDPFQGPCNLMNATSWWAQQDAYRVTRLNALKTHSAPPVIPACPAIETTNEKTTFAPGETVYTIPYFRDQIQDQSIRYSLVLPSGAEYNNWTHSSPATYSASSWIWAWPLPANAQLGTWKFRAVVSGITYETNFTVAVPTATIGGRVTTPGGQGLRNAVVSLISPTGLRRTATTSSFGIYSFPDVPIGTGTSTLTVSSKRYRFSPLSLTISRDNLNLDLNGLE